MSKENCDTGRSKPQGSSFLVHLSICVRRNPQIYVKRDPQICQKRPEIWRGPLDILAGEYGVATISRLLKMTGLFCKRAL